MSPRDALNLINQALDNKTVATKQEHVQLQQAAMALNGLVMQFEQTQTVEPKFAPTPQQEDTKPKK